jgi:multiple sugar transport system permease protein
VPATFINRIEKFTLVVGLQTVNMSFFQKANLTMAGVVLLSFPVILFFIFNQKKFVQGVMSSGIKA